VKKRTEGQRVFIGNGGTERGKKRMDGLTQEERDGTPRCVCVDCL